MIIYLTHVLVNGLKTDKAQESPTFPVPPDLNQTIWEFLRNALGTKGGFGVYGVYRRAKSIDFYFLTKQNPEPQKYNALQIWCSGDPVQIDFYISPGFSYGHDTDLRWMDLTFCKVRELISEVYHKPDFIMGLRETWRERRGVGSSLNQLF